MSNPKVTPAVLCRMAADVIQVEQSINNVATFLDQEAHILAIAQIQTAAAALREASKILATFYLGSYDEADPGQPE